MPFTDRFIRFKIDLFDSGIAENIGYGEDAKTVEVIVSVNPLDITYYRDTFDKGVPLNEVLVYLKNGEYLNAKLTIKEFEKLLNDHLK